MPIAQHEQPETLPWVCQSYNAAVTLLVHPLPKSRVLNCDWLIPGVNVLSAANADVDFGGKMASLVADVQTNRPGSVSWDKKRSEMKTTRNRRIMNNGVLSLLLFAAMWDCVAADGKTLVLLDNLNIRDTHSIFFRSLAGDYEFLTFSVISTPFLQCIKGKKYYKHFPLAKDRRL